MWKHVIQKNMNSKRAVVCIVHPSTEPLFHQQSEGLQVKTSPSVLLYSSGFHSSQLASVHQLQPAHLSPSSSCSWRMLPQPTSYRLAAVTVTVAHNKWFLHKHLSRAHRSLLRFQTRVMTASGLVLFREPVLPIRASTDFAPSAMLECAAERERAYCLYCMHMLRQLCRCWWVCSWQDFMNLHVVHLCGGKRNFVFVHGNIRLNVWGAPEKCFSLWDPVCFIFCFYRHFKSSSINIISTSIVIHDIQMLFLQWKVECAEEKKSYF